MLWRRDECKEEEGGTQELVEAGMKVREGAHPDGKRRGWGEAGVAQAEAVSAAPSILSARAAADKAQGRPP